LINNLANLVTTSDVDDAAMDFDNLMYGLMLAQLSGAKGFSSLRRNVVSRALALQKKTTIPQVKVKLPVIKEVAEGEFWNAADILSFERIRVEPRELMKFLERYGRKDVNTDLLDQEIGRMVAKEFDMSGDFEDYRQKVNKYIEENKNSIAIHKLRNNVPLNESDFKTLESILTGQLGTKKDYQNSFKDTPFGLLVRRIAKLEREAVLKAFSSFISEQNLDAYQIEFIYKVINYIEQNGYVENVAELTRPPFDKPRSFIKLFDGDKQERIVRIINEIKDNAVRVVG